MSLKILYCQPKESFGDTRFLTSFLRISNYLNSKKEKLNGEIEEEYIDLRYEDLPSYCPESLPEFREKLENLILNIYKRFRFDVLAITCFTSFTYLNCIETSWMVKKINPSCQIVVGGVHPTTCPGDFYAENIPEHFGDYFPGDSTPIDAICMDEGEKPFFNFVHRFLDGQIKPRKTLQDPPLILKRDLMEDLDDLPLIDLCLFKKYQKVFEQKGEFYINFSRGCL
ncbi:MAG: cobalamin-dependent protein, partial [Candidatus Hermodarchaeota archaeon]